VHHDHFSVFAILAVVIAVLGSWTALDLFQRVRSHVGRDRLAWLAGAGLAMGSSIWSMHFVAMLGFDPGSPVSYDLPLTGLSLVLAVGGTGVAFVAAASGSVANRTAARARVAVAGLVMGASICLMHYVGMAALKTAAVLGYDHRLVAASLALAVAASIAALLAARRDRSSVWRAVAAGGLGLAIVGMHYTGMAALQLTPAMDAGAPGAPPLVLALAVAGGAIGILVLGLAASFQDQRGNLLTIIDAGGVGYWELSLPRRTLSVSARARAILGVAPDAPFTQKDLEALLDEADRPLRLQALAEALTGAVPYDVEYRLKDQDRWIHLRGRLIHSRSGRPLKLAGVVTESTDQRRAFVALADSERRQALLINELNHRVKNTLATIQSIATLTARQTSDVPEFKERFEARLIALSNTHNVLTANGWDRAAVATLLAQEFRPYPEDQVAMTGPAVDLEAEQALALGLIIHEMATNAAKYGALSRPEGRIAIAWSWTDPQARRLRLDWTETGGPPVVPPTRKGFGSRLIRTSAEGALRGGAEVDYRPEGVVCRLTMTVAGVGGAD
jgi:NO-binding membrane sensor protein with MHYT domain/two-component sensor histidine kinase